MGNLAPKIKAMHRKNIEDFSAIVFGRYPRFVYRRIDALGRNEVPIFVFHSVFPDFFERQMNYLAQNSYRTLTADKLYKVITGVCGPKDKAVAITFDDGTKSLWTTAFPILKKYGFRATCFIVPHWIKPGAGENTRVQNCWEGGVACDAIVRKELDDPLCSWDEIKTMQESGVIDFQSHTSYHHSVFTSSKLVGFVNPELMPSFLNSDLNPVIHAGGKNCYRRSIDLGQPVYEYAPAMKAKKRYLEDEKLAHKCTTFVKDRGGLLFFRRSNWKRHLIDRYQDYKKKNLLQHRYQSAEERYEEIRNDLLYSKNVIEEKLRKKVTHLCYPWYAGSDWAVKASQEVGYLSNHWGILNGKTVNHVGQDPMYMYRINDEYIFSLPGKGRIPLSKILLGKAQRLRFQRQTVDRLSHQNYLYLNS
jgi:hypothetical protein